MSHQSKTVSITPSPQHCELMIQSNGQILAHNLTAEIAEVLAQLNPNDEDMNARSPSTRRPS